MIKNNFLICLVGLPASGKTTFSRELKKVLKENSQLEIIIIDPDKIRNDINPNHFDFKKERQVREQNIEMIKNALQDNCIVISDDLNYYSSMRHDLKDITDNLRIPLFIIHISTPLDICLKWNEERGNTIPNEVILDINRKLDDFNKYKWDKSLMTLDLSKAENITKSAEESLIIIDKTLNDVKIGSKIINVQKTKNNQGNERLDIITRKIVEKIINLPHNASIKDKILALRKEFVKTNLNRSLNESEISMIFKNFLGERLSIKIF